MTCLRRVAILLLSGLSWSAIDLHAGLPSLPVVQQQLAALAVPFVFNAGQWDQRVAFAARTFAGTLFVTTEGQLVYRLPGKQSDHSPAAAAVGTDCLESDDARGDSRLSDAAVSHANCIAANLSYPTRRPDYAGVSRVASRTPGWVLTQTLVDAAGRTLPATPLGERLQEGKVSFAIGSDARKHRDAIDTWERVDLGDVYPGINVKLRATGSNVEKIFTVAPAREPAAIRLRIEGTDKLEPGAQGELIVHTGNGPVTYTVPFAYQEDAAGERTAVPARYAINAAARTYGFALGTYDIGGGVARFVVATGNDLASCTPDIDGNISIDALTDGLMILRAMFGLTGTAVTNNAVGANARRATWSVIRAYLNTNYGTSFPA